MKDNRTCTLYCYNYNKTHKRMSVENIEAVETSKLYKFTDKHNITYLSQISKDTVGNVTDDFSNLWVILVEENRNMAIQKFIQYHQEAIDGLQKKIDENEAALQEFKKMLEQREDMAE